MLVLDEVKTYDDAKNEAAKRRAVLAYITSPEENACVAGKVTTVGPGGYLMGAEYRGAETNFEWRWTGARAARRTTATVFWQGVNTGSSVSGAFANWQGGEPNNSPNDQEAIVCAFFMSENSQWLDEHCNYGLWLFSGGGGPGRIVIRYP